MKFNNIKEIINSAKKEGRNVLDLKESRDVLQELGVKLNIAEIAKEMRSATKIAKKIGFPVAMKIVSPQILHKTEAGGVFLDVRDAKSVRETYKNIIKNAKAAVPDARITGVLIEEMLSGNELIVGTVRDPLFGNMVMFGIGGLLVELYKDVTFRLIPLKRIDVLEMLDEIRAKEILNGYRKSPPVDREELVNIVLNISELVNSLPEIASMEINPLVITNRGLIGIDARVIITPGI